MGVPFQRISLICRISGLELFGVFGYSRLQELFFQLISMGLPFRDFPKSTRRSEELKPKAIFWVKGFFLTGFELGVESQVTY